MAPAEENQRNQATYQRLKPTIDNTYPKGWFVGITDDRIVGVAASFRDLEATLRAAAKDPVNVLVVEVGVKYPEHVTIFWEQQCLAGSSARQF